MIPAVAFWQYKTMNEKLQEVNRKLENSQSAEAILLANINASDVQRRSFESKIVDSFNGINRLESELRKLDDIVTLMNSSVSEELIAVVETSKSLFQSVSAKVDSLTEAEKERILFETSVMTSIKQQNHFESEIQQLRNESASMIGLMNSLPTSHRIEEIDKKVSALEPVVNVIADLKRSLSENNSLILDTTKVLFNSLKSEVNAILALEKSNKDAVNDSLLKVRADVEELQNATWSTEPSRDQQSIIDIETKISELQSLKTEVAALQCNVSDINDRATSLETKSASDTTLAGALSQQIQRSRDETSALQREASLMNERLSSEIVELKSKAQLQSQSIDRLTSAVGEIKSIKEDIQGIKDTALTEINSLLEGQDASIRTIESSVERLKSEQLTALQTSVATLEGRVTGVEGETQRVGAGLPSLQTSLDAVTEKVEAVETQLAVSDRTTNQALDVVRGGLDELAVDLSSKVQEATAYTRTVSTSVDVLRSSIDGINSQLSNRVNMMDSALGTINSTISNKLTTVESYVQSMSYDIDQSVERLEDVQDRKIDALRAERQEAEAVARTQILALQEKMGDALQALDDVSLKNDRTTRALRIEIIEKIEESAKLLAQLDTETKDGFSEITSTVEAEKYSVAAQIEALKNETLTTIDSKEKLVNKRLDSVRTQQQQSDELLLNTRNRLSSVQADLSATTSSLDAKIDAVDASVELRAAAEVKRVGFRARVRRASGTVARFATEQARGIGRGVNGAVSSVGRRGKAVGSVAWTTVKKGADALRRLGK